MLEDWVGETQIFKENVDLKLVVVDRSGVEKRQGQVFLLLKAQGVGQA